MTVLMLAEAPSTLAIAWRNSGELCVQTGLAIVRHPLAVLVCAAIPAAERGYVLAQRKVIPRLRLTLLEATVTLWRVLLCVVAIWVALSIPERMQLRQHLGSLASWELALQHLGAHLGNHLRVVLWEYVLFLVAFLLLNAAIRKIVKALTTRWHKEHSRAAISVVRNLFLVPLAVIYLVETLRPMFR